jgi:acyl carrier protein
MLPVYLSNNRESNLDIKHELLSILDEILSLNGRAASFKEDTPLLGAIPELDSMAVVALITAIEERFGVAMEDDEIDGSVFATVGSLTGFVQSKLTT